ncbi:MAG: hypothetical protein L6R40_000687 [Gallowayella cf. fulva]|nr:MAG: hypothetical protein L6R40_000687 [Xanthomendoza cf. fulva]
MVPIRHLLLLLAAINWTYAANVGCWKQPNPPAKQYYTTIFKHCIDAIQDLAKLDKAFAPILFSRKKGVGYKVPERWMEKTCFIVIDMHNDEDEEYVSFHEIAVEAGVIAGACVARPPHLGGTGRVGKNQLMNVTIVGVRWRNDHSFAIG